MHDMMEFRCRLCLNNVAGRRASNLLLRVLVYRFVEQAIDPRAVHHSKLVLIRLLVAFTKSRKLAVFIFLLIKTFVNEFRQERFHHALLRMSSLNYFSFITTWRHSGSKALTLKKGVESSPSVFSAQEYPLPRMAQGLSWRYSIS